MIGRVNVPLPLLSKNGNSILICSPSNFSTDIAGSIAEPSSRFKFRFHFLPSSHLCPIVPFGATISPLFSSSITGFQSARSEEHTSELQSRFDLVCRLLLEKKKTKNESHK